jgi:hypothetical protein
LSLNLPVIGQSSATEDQKTRDALSAIQTLLNGNLDTANLLDNSVGGGDLDPAGIPFPLRMIADRSTYLTGLAATTFVIGDAERAATGSVGARFTMIPFDPANYAATGRSLRLRVLASGIQNSVAAGIGLTFFLASVTIGAGASGAGNTTAAATAVSGSGVTLTLGGTGTFAQVMGPDFAAPAAGLYVLCVVSAGGTQAAGSIVDVRSHLLYHHV